MRIDFYQEWKYCNRCKRYVRFLMSNKCSYCIHCDGEVQVFSETDRKDFLREIKERKKERNSPTFITNYDGYDELEEGY